LDMVTALGLRLIRTDIFWHEVEVEPGRYNWGRYDELVAKLRARGITPLLILAYSNPLYARSLTGNLDRPETAYEAPVEQTARSAFVAFAQAAAARYRDVIWEIWNEPNHFFGRPVQIQRYVQLAMDSCEAIRSVDPNAPVIGPAAAGFTMPLLEP